MMVMTSIPDPDCIVNNINYDVLRNLYAELNVNENWKKIVMEFNRQRGLFTDYDVGRFKANKSPSEAVIEFLGSRCCPVHELCTILKDCKLYDALALLKEPESARITRHPSDNGSTVYVEYGGRLKLRCDADGLPPPTYMWLRDNVNLEEQTSNILTIDNFNEDDQGEYCCCVIQNVANDVPYEQLSHKVCAELEPIPPTVHVHPEPFVQQKEGDVVTLTIIADGYPEPEYEWQFEKNVIIAGENANTLQITVGPESEGTYRCYVRNKAGETWSNESKVILVYDPTIPGIRMTATEKVALLIGNETYDNLSNTVTSLNDVVTIAAILRDRGFKVIALQNLTLNEMKNAVREFSKMLIKDCYGVFYFAGHGFEIEDRYMLPVDAPGCREYRRCHCFCERELLRDVMEVEPKLMVVILDMCLVIPNEKDNPEIYEERVKNVFRYKVKRNLIQHYSTCSDSVALERSTENTSLYVQHLKSHLIKDMSISDIFEMVKLDLSNESKDAADRQIPTLTSTVVDCFYFNDDMIGDPRTESHYNNITSLLSLDSARFSRLNYTTPVKIQPHRGFFLNAIDVFINIRSWQAVCFMACENLRMELERKGSELQIIIHNLQKTKISLMLTVTLKDPKTKQELDSYTFDFGRPLITPAHLWFNYPDDCQQQTGSGHS